MANEKHLNLLRQGVEAWNQWREENLDIRMDLSEANLSGADLSGARLIWANLFNADLSRANLTQADLTEADLFQADLTQAYLSKAYLYQTDLYQADLTQAYLSSAYLSEADLSEANLSGADLSAADLSAADLSRANLSEANLSEANLYQANLTQASLSDANLSNASVTLTIFGDIDLSKVKGLETVHHDGPSTIGIDTIYHSKGNIPEAFLRGCGLRDWEIEAAKLYNPDLTSVQINDIVYKITELRGDNPLQYNSCFISYSSKDDEFAQRLHADLQNKGVRCWFAPEDMKIGDKIRTRIDESIRIHDKLLLVLSKHSINSDWVEKEVETAFEEEHKRKQTVLFPIQLDATVMKTNQAWAADIRRTRHIGDFRNWKDYDAYQKALNRLLRDLKAEATKPTT